MATYILTATTSTYIQSPPARRVLLKHKTVAQVAFEAARFARWSENGTNGINKVYRQFLQNGYPPTNPNGTDVTA